MLYIWYPELIHLITDQFPYFLHPLATTILFSGSVCTTSWDHTVLVFLCLADFSWHNVCQAHPRYHSLLYSFICPADMQIVSISCLLWTVLQWTWVCRYLFEILISFLLDIYPEEGLLDHVITVVFSLLRRLHTVPSWLYRFAFPPTAHKGFLFFLTALSACLSA